MNALKGLPRPSAIPIGEADAAGKAKLFDGCGSPRRIVANEKGGGNGGPWKARKHSGCFPTFPQTLEIAPRVHREMQLVRSDSHIPSARNQTAKLS